MQVADTAATLLRGIADGSMIVTVGPLAEPRPTAVERGQGFALRGIGSLVPDVAAADVFLILADDSDGSALFAVQASSVGLAATPEIGVDQTRKQYRVTFEGVPAQRLASAPAHAVEALVDDVLVAWAADALGAAQAVMNRAVEYAKVRRQFGQLIGSFQAVQHLCVDMYETVELARAGVLHALWAADAAEPAERHLAAARAKAFAARLATVADTAIQVLGGVGYTWEHDAHLYLKRLLSWSAFLGGPDQYLIEVGSHVAQLARERAPTARPTPWPGRRIPGSAGRRPTSG
jgi:alkylation response protein AidB-like acyl-CoA dehydrogenase